MEQFGICYLIVVHNINTDMHISQGAVLSMFADLSHETSQQTVASAHTIDFPRTRLRSPPSPMLPPSPAKTNPELRLFDSDSDPDSIEIPFEQLKLNQLVGCGSFGKVHAATWHGKVAVKTVCAKSDSKHSSIAN